MYFLSLLNLWKKRASPLSCLPSTGIMLYDCIGPVGRVQRGEKKFTWEKILKKYIQKHHAKAFPLSLVDLFFFFLPLCSLILSQKRTTIFEHSVSPLCLHGKKKKSPYTYMFLLRILLGTANGSVQKNKSVTYLSRKYTPPMESTFSAWKYTRKNKRL